MTAADGAVRRGRLLMPEGTPRGVVVYLHGGGWVVTDLDDYDASARALTNAAGAVVVTTVLSLDAPAVLFTPVVVAAPRGPPPVAHLPARSGSAHGYYLAGYFQAGHHAGHWLAPVFARAQG